MAHASRVAHNIGKGEVQPQNLQKNPTFCSARMLATTTDCDNHKLTPQSKSPSSFPPRVRSNATMATIDLWQERRGKAGDPGGQRMAPRRKTLLGVLWAASPIVGIGRFDNRQDAGVDGLGQVRLCVHNSGKAAVIRGLRRANCTGFCSARFGRCA